MIPFALVLLYETCLFNNIAFKKSIEDSTCKYPHRPNLVNKCVKIHVRCTFLFLCVVYT